MKVLILADLHLDEYHTPEALLQFGREIRTVGEEADALIVAGDLCELPSSQRWAACLGWLREQFPRRPIHIIPGNHDYYGDTIRGAENAMSRACGVHGCALAQRSEFVIGDTRFLAATLWTDFALFRAARGIDAVGAAMLAARTKMPDYSYGSIGIGNPERPLRPMDTARLHQLHLAWLEERLAAPHDGKTVVVTHHAPSASVAGTLRDLSPCFASDLDALIDTARPEAWIFGHTHRDAELRAPGGTLLRNVSIGSEAEMTPDRLRDRVRVGLLDLADLAKTPADFFASENPQR